MPNKTDLIKTNESNLVEITDKRGVEAGVEKILMQNINLLPQSVATDRIKAAAGFYIANKPELMELSKQGKLQMLYGVLKEAVVGCEAGTDYDIVVFKQKPVVCRKKEGWYKIIELIRPADIVKFVVNVATKGDQITFDPVTETITHKMDGMRGQNYADIIAAYAYVKFANGFEKAVYLDKSDIDHIRNLSPSKNSEYSPWNAHAVKMVKTKAAKELAKELFTLFSGRLNAALQQAAMSDEEAIRNITLDGRIQGDMPQLEPNIPPMQINAVQANVDGVTGEIIDVEELDMGGV